MPQKPHPTPEAFLPLKPVVFHVLLSLADNERHGYGIVQDIAARSSARLRLLPGNLYRSLQWMLDRGLIEESDRRPAADRPGGHDERRRFYRITRFGRQVTSAETRRLEAVVAEAKARNLVKERS
jgi:DNA-binding PadR family transcriptional regulator